MWLSSKIVIGTAVKGKAMNIGNDNEKLMIPDLEESRTKK